MIAGLPWESWLLLLASVGAGLCLVAVFYVRRRDGRGPRRGLDGRDGRGGRADRPRPDGRGLRGDGP